jgi:archaellum component FlaC
MQQGSAPASQGAPQQQAPVQTQVPVKQGIPAPQAKSPAQQVYQQPSPYQQQAYQQPPVSQQVGVFPQQQAPMQQSVPAPTPRAPPQQQAYQQAQNLQQAPPQYAPGFAQPSPYQQQAYQQPPVSQQVGVFPQQQAPMPRSYEGGGLSPLDALQGRAAPEGRLINLVEIEGSGQGQIMRQTAIQQNVLPAGQQDALPTDQAGINETVVEESLEELKEEYDDAKLNSVIIEQVKELIEIDTNLNNKIEDIRVDLKRETTEREKLAKDLKEHRDELKELEKSIDKFIALYELVTNQFNPFVKQDDPETKKQMQKLMEDVRAKQDGRLVQQEGLTETDFHFVSKTGSRVKSLPELVALLETMSDEEFFHHVDMQKNDFASWILHALKNQTLATKVSALKKRQDMLLALKS